MKIPALNRWLQTSPVVQQSALYFLVNGVGQDALEMAAGQKKELEIPEDDDDEIANVPNVEIGLDLSFQTN